jgi:hypothetical protein
MTRANSQYWKDVPLRQARLGAAVLAVTVVLLHAAPNQRTFATPQEAAQAAIEAAEHNDTAALLKLFGPDGKDIVDSGDPTEDKKERAEFARRAREKMQVSQDPTNPDRAVFSVGEQDWPFPVPLVRKDGQWRFDSSQGRLEILARRIGANEIDAMEVCRGYVEAQLEYAAQDRDAHGTLQYAQKIVSSPGKHDGLYWEGAPETLVPKSFAGAAAASQPEGGGKPKPYHGYYFHILKAQGADAPGGGFNYVVKGEMIGGFALAAWPTEYGVSGVRTFIVNHRGIVYEKDLGPRTAAVARQMTQFNPDKSWRQVEPE